MRRKKLDFRKLPQLAITVAAACLGNAAVADDGINGVPLHGFADAGWGRAGAGQPAREKVRGFALGTFDLYINPTFGDHVRALVEFVMEPSFNLQAEAPDVERLQVGYAFSDAATLWVGRFHSPYGYWNTAYHHGAEIQPSIYKPRFLDWEDHAGFMPSHQTGLWLTGKADAGSGQVLYDLWASNGNRNLTPVKTPNTGSLPGGSLDMNILSADNTSTASGARLSYRFGGAQDGLTLGLHGLLDDVRTYDTSGDLYVPVSRSMMRMYGGYAVYEAHAVELSSEVYRFSNYDPSVNNSKSYGSSAGFLHVGYYATPEVMPYLRVERAKINQSDSYFNTQINGFSYDRAVLGSRYNLNARACIKVEVNRTIIRDTTANVRASAFNEVRTQYAIAF